MIWLLDDQGLALGLPVMYIRKPVAGIAQLVERNLAKVDVAGSSPVSRSTRKSAWYNPLARKNVKVPMSPVSDTGTFLLFPCR